MLLSSQGQAMLNSVNAMIVFLESVGEMRSVFVKRVKLYLQDNFFFFLVLRDYFYTLKCKIIFAIVFEGAIGVDSLRSF